MTQDQKSKINQLIDKGVRIACPDSIHIGDEVNAIRAGNSNPLIDQLIYL